MPLQSLAPLIGHIPELPYKELIVKDRVLLELAFKVTALTLPKAVSAGTVPYADGLVQLVTLLSQAVRRFSLLTPRF